MEINVRNKKTYSGDGEYIGRPSVLGNPFKIKNKQSRLIAIQRYEHYLTEALNKEGHVAYMHDAIVEALTILFEKLIKNQKLNLICHCTPELCHGNIIRKILLNKYHHGTWLIDGSTGMNINDTR